MHRHAKKTIYLTIVAALLSLWLIKAPIVSSYLSQALGMRVSVATVSWHPSQLKMGFFKITNPHKYKSPYALTADSIHFSYAWKEMMNEPKIIDEIVIDQIYLAIEFANALGTENNWTDLISRMPERKKDAKEVIIRKLVLTNMTVDIQGMGLFAKHQTKTIDRIEFNDVSSETGFPTRELISEIFGSANLLDYIKNIIPTGPGDIIKKLLPFGKLFNEKGQDELPAPDYRDDASLS